MNTCACTVASVTLEPLSGFRVSSNSDCSGDKSKKASSMQDSQREVAEEVVVARRVVVTEGGKLNKGKEGL